MNCCIKQYIFKQKQGRETGQQDKHWKSAMISYRLACDRIHEISFHNHDIRTDDTSMYHKFMKSVLKKWYYNILISQMHGIISLKFLIINMWYDSDEYIIHDIICYYVLWPMISYMVHIIVMSYVIQKQFQAVGTFEDCLTGKKI